MSESKIKADVRVTLSKLGVVNFNNPVGEGWLGKHHFLPDGKILIEHPRRVVFGLTPGASDLIGWRPVLITHEMVGLTLAQFVGVETKDKGGRLREDQKRFLETLNQAGGKGVVLYSAEQVIHFFEVCNGNK